MDENTPPAGEEGRYPQIIKAVRETPWAIMPGKLAEMLSMLAERNAGRQLSHEEIQARIGGGPPRRDLQMVGTVAVIPVYGVISGRADLFTAMSGGTSVQRLQDTFRDAISDEDVTAVVLDIDSPGGSTDLIPELAATIRGVRGKKPVVAVANTRAASAAYWIGAQADEFVVTPSGDVGSIGVFAAHSDLSGAQEKMGVKTTFISAGKFKTEGNPFEPLSEEARAAIQATVDEYYGMFVKDVAMGRRVTAATVREDFGQGRMLTAVNAVKAGMADRLDTLEATVQRFARGQQLPPPAPPPEPDLLDDDHEAATSGLSFADRSEAARGATLQLVGRVRSLARVTGVKREQLASVEAAHRAVADTIAELLTEPQHQPEQAALDASAEAEFAWVGRHAI